MDQPWAFLTEQRAWQTPSTSNAVKMGLSNLSNLSNRWCPDVRGSRFKVMFSPSAAWSQWWRICFAIFARSLAVRYDRDWGCKTVSLDILGPRVCIYIILYNALQKGNQYFRQLGEIHLVWYFSEFPVQRRADGERKLQNSLWTFGVQSWQHGFLPWAQQFCVMTCCHIPRQTFDCRCCHRQCGNLCSWNRAGALMCFVIHVHNVLKEDGQDGYKIDMYVGAFESTQDAPILWICAGSAWSSPWNTEAGLSPGLSLHWHPLICSIF